MLWAVCILYTVYTQQILYKNTLAILNALIFLLHDGFLFTASLFILCDRNRNEFVGNIKDRYKQKRITVQTEFQNRWHVNSRLC